MRGKITGLPFPANSEIGSRILKTSTGTLEGPFGEWTGYYASDAGHWYRQIEAIYRNDPIILWCAADWRRLGRDGAGRRSWCSAMLKQQLQSAGVPDVTQVWSHEIGASRMLIALAIKQRYAGHAKQVGVLAASCGASVYGCKMVIVVDEHIDVSNLRSSSCGR